MRFRSILREVWRNTLSGTSRCVLLSAVLVALVVVALGADIVAVSTLEAKAETFRASGASVLTLRAQGRVDGDRCEALRELSGVRAAGALTIREADPVVPAALPGAPMEAADVSPGMLAVLGAASDGGPGIVIVSDTATTLGLQIGDPFATTEGLTRLAGTYTYPRDGRRDGYGYLALEVTGAGQVFDECWVDVWPADDAVRPLLFTVLRSGDGTEEAPQVEQLNASLGTAFDGDEQYRGRVTRLAGICAGLLAAGVGFLATRGRRVELASALHDGMRRRDLWSVVLLEAILWTFPAVSVGTAMSLVWSGEGGDLVVGAVLGARVTVTTAVGSLVGVCCALAVTREKDLFAYAKER